MPPISPRQQFAAIVLAVFYPGCIIISSPVIWGLPWEIVFPGDFFAFLYPLSTFASLLPAMIGLAALWCVWGPVRPWLRFAMVAVAAIVLHLMWLAGFLATMEMIGPSRRPGVGFEFVLANASFQLALPGIVIAAALPPLMLRLLFGFRLAHPGDDPATPARDSFSLGSLMAVTGLVAVALGTSRLRYTVLDVSPGDEQMLNTAVLWAWGAGISLASLVPAVLFILWPREWAAVIALAGCYFLAATVVVLCLMGGPEGSVFFIPQSLSIFTVALILPLLVARWIGYRLRRGK